MGVLVFLQANPAAFLIVAGLLGLMVGSFLNVVIHRLPVMLERQWRSQCAELEPASGATAAAPAQRYDLIHPRSACPHCNHPIAAYDNLPVFSYLLLRGRCRHCGTRIRARYPVIEALTGALSVLVAIRFGFGWETLWALILTWSLLALAVIDIDHQILPDAVTLPLLWLGLLLSLGQWFTTPVAGIIGAAAGYASLWLVYQVFRLVTGKEGMGYGDFKLLAAIGAWLGWQALPAVVLLASVTGAVVGISQILLGARARGVPIPFGPYLAAGGWIALLWGDALLQSYLRFAGLVA